MIAVIREEKKYILWLLLFYTLTQGMILIISGMWNDDWCLVNISDEGLKMWALETGCPEIYSVFHFSLILPDSIIRLIVFLGYYVITVCFFIIVKNTICRDSFDSFCAALILLCIPINDSRVEYVILRYSIGLLLFTLSFCILILKYENLGVLYRILTLVLFFISYMLNSLLVFMGLVWLFIIVREKAIIAVLRKADYLFLPFLYYLIKVIVFPAHGIYSGYNGVSLTRMLKGIGNTFIAENTLFVQVLNRYTSLLNDYPFHFIIILLLIYLIYNEIFVKRSVTKGINDGANSTIDIVAKEVFIGLISLFLGIFPYIVVGNDIAIEGFNSRNGILSVFGFALIIHAVLSIGLNRVHRCMVITLLLLLSIFHFGDTYLKRQCIYYGDLGLQVFLSSHPELNEFNNIGVIENDSGSSFYAYNGIFERAFGNEKRLVENLKYPDNFNSQTLNMFKKRAWYNMTEYEYNDNRYDCVIVYSNNMTSEDALYIRVNEILRRDISSKLINKANFRVLYPEDEEYSQYAKN